ncbi:uncharacterized protein LOC144692991 [Cetorhinus maximus]
MADSGSELCGELGYRSGERRRFAVRTPCTIQGLLSGVRLLQQQLSGPLTQLVLQEKQRQEPSADSPASSSAGEDEDDSEDELANKGDGDAPPAKRTRNQC